METNNQLQEIRKATIPDLIKKYQKLVDDIFKAAGAPLPVFSNILDKDTDETISTAEQQLYAFIGVRDTALNTANSILIKINELQRELYDPTFWDKEIVEELQANTNQDPTKKFRKK
ncbi:hypothetical protein [Flavobacterium sp. HSC-61S13]|uniref:hypothetical protein n=1 Tax=Flavobacterium sp. HSC-61S13 TaxID=2910963 RepID=UPI00209E893D|nr:hypothetical protein [Flavobacterium sp. HSC-61S13]MCP1996659.1 hypothetical protein [Flavobacterium sp. HSC-61S13]